MAKVDSTVNEVKAQHVAEAYHAVARVNHYLVGVVGAYSEEELDRAEQILINKQTAGPQKGKAYTTLELALDLVEQARRERRG